MAGLLFVAQAVLDSWAGQGKIDLHGSSMTLRAGAGQGRTYALEPAVRFLSVVGGDPDPHGLVAKVKSETQLRSLRAECLGNSVILGEVGYEVQPGFLAELSALQAAAAAAQAPAPDAQASRPAPTSRPPARLPKDLEDKRKEAEALARFLLENLS